MKTKTGDCWGNLYHYSILFKWHFLEISTLDNNEIICSTFVFVVSLLIFTLDYFNFYLSLGVQRKKKKKSKMSQLTISYTKIRKEIFM